MMQFWSAGSVAQGLIQPHPPPAIQATRRLQMAPCAKRDAQSVPRQLGVAMGARAAYPRRAADPHLFSPASTAAFLRATSRRRVAAEQLVVRCAGPADASAGGGLKCAMAALTAFMSCGARAAAAHVRCSPSRGAGLARRPLLRAAGCFQCVSGVSTFLGILVRTRNCNGSQCADPRAHKETAMVRNQLTPKCNLSNRCSFTKPTPGGGFPVCD